MRERSAISRRLCFPSDWVSTQSMASCSRSAAGPPTLGYNPRFPSWGSPSGARFT